MDEIRRDPIKWFIEGFGVLTGGFFVLSGLANAVSFFLLWRLNYFLIASPSDVVMSAFIFGLIVVIGVGVIGLIGVGTYRLLSAVGLHIPPSVWAGSLAGGIGDWVAEMLSKALEERTFRQAYDRAVRTLLTMALIAGVSNLLVWLASGAPRDLSLALRPFWYETGLNVSSESAVPDACKGAHVAWLGASAAVLECRDRIHVLHKLDNLQTERRFGEKAKPKLAPPPRRPAPPPQTPVPAKPKANVETAPASVTKPKGSRDGG